MNSLIDDRKTSATESKEQENHGRQDLNYGRVVERAVRRNAMGISEIARRLGVSRRTLYNWFDIKDLSPDIISKIGFVLDYDFSGDFPEDFFKGTKASETEVTGSTSRSSGLSPTDPVYYWMSMYIKLLENFNERLARQRKIDY
ncbi:helix-turn-helix domain-containing protein [Mucilaginibacter aquariorum]|uniref:Helix-turn-helix domain-containing protein n=1 Tax=Mucilaginibacter aquariorum TaxID=2967225 RepID=A0ABT1T407_9SPHI|nr:helix-turn-helix domain-containing protein [Mucilaginibacter aquariorum]MCQ6959299.1 helix-turn-helix domain-containing protein [Mucilaginibacter aquariorum]